MRANTNLCRSHFEPKKKRENDEGRRKEKGKRRKKKKGTSVYIGRNN